jgi:hypothetical protein
MQVNDKSNWLEYYSYYTTSRFPNHIIIKCDDDIVYIDVVAFPKFIRHRRLLKTHLLMFPNIVNNGVCAFYQQACGLLPEKVVGSMPFDPAYGKLWSSGELAEQVHDYFINYESDWTEKAAKLPVREYPVGHRFSINLFAILSKDLFVFQRLRNDDESELSYYMPLVTRRPHCVDLSFTISHLSFYKQREESEFSRPIDEQRLIRCYHKLAHKKGVPAFSA